jgi:predicted permease
MSDWNGFGLDFRRAMRGLMRSRAFTLTAVAVLGGSVAPTTAVFAFVQGTLLERPPFAEPERLVLAWGSEPVNGQLRDVISGSNFIDLRTRTTTLAPLAAFHFDDATLMRGGRPVVLGVLQVTVDFLRVLGVRPARGTDFSELDRNSGGRRSAIASYGFWQEALGGRTDVVGSSIELNGEPVTIIGVLPAGFRFAGTSALYVPLHDDALAAEERTHHHYHMIGRLVPGARPVAATAELSAILADIGRSDPRLRVWKVLVDPLLDVSVEAVRPALWTLAAAVLLVFAVGIVNLGTLFRIRTLERTGEFAVRTALGATRRRTAASVIAESVVVAAIGGAVGLVVAPFALDLLATIAPAQVLIPNSAASVPVLRASMSPALILVAAIAAIAAGLLVAVPSVVTALRVSPSRAVGSSGVRVTSSDATRWLVAAELALATLLAIGATLTWRSAQYLASRESGVDTPGVLTAYFGNASAMPVEERANYFRRVLAAIAQVPGVEHTGIIDYLPFEGEDDFKGMRFPERPIPPPGQGVREEWRRVTDGYLATSGMRLMSGRSFTSDDFFGTPRSVLINQAFASKHYRGENPIGRRLMLAENGYRDLEIIGVVGNVLERGPMVAPPAMVYVPFQASPRGTVALFVRFSGDPLAHAGAVQDAIWSVDSRQPVMEMKTLESVVRSAMATPTMVMRLVGAMAAAALGLAALGVFGVVAFAVRARTREFGVRMALGATAGRLSRDVVSRFFPVAAAGVGAGAVLGIGAVGALRSVLYGVAPGDPFSFGVAIVAVIVLATLAAWVPTRTMAGLDPARLGRDP